MGYISQKSINQQTWNDASNAHVLPYTLHIDREMITVKPNYLTPFRLIYFAFYTFALMRCWL